METSKITAQRRTGSGRSVARQLRRAGQLPAVIYGKGQPATALAISPKEFELALAGPLGRNAVFQVDIEGVGASHALLADFQYHPLSRKLLHVDFKALDDGEFVDVEVPLVLTGKPKGVVMGGELRQVFRRIPVRCLPADIPAVIEASVAELDIDQMLHAGALELPSGCELTLSSKLTVAAVVGGRRDKDEEEKPAAGAPAA